MRVFCSNCNGVGDYPVPMPPCPHCGGALVIKYPPPTAAAAVLQTRKGKRLRVMQPDGRLAFLASEDEVSYLIADGQAKGFGPGSRLLGCVLLSSAGAPPESDTRYVHRINVRWKNEDGEQQRKIYQLKRITYLGRPRFMAPLLEAGAHTRRQATPRFRRIASSDRTVEVPRSALTPPLARLSA